MEIKLIWSLLSVLGSGSKWPGFKAHVFSVLARDRGISTDTARHKVQFAISKLRIEAASQILSGVYKDRLFLLHS